MQFNLKARTETTDVYCPLADAMGQGFGEMPEHTSGLQQPEYGEAIRQAGE